MSGEGGVNWRAVAVAVCLGAIGWVLFGRGEKKPKLTVMDGGKKEPAAEKENPVKTESDAAQGGEPAPAAPADEPSPIAAATAAARKKK